MTVQVSEQAGYVMETPAGTQVTEHHGYALMANTGIFLTEQHGYAFMIHQEVNRHRQVLLGSF